MNRNAAGLTALAVANGASIVLGGGPWVPLASVACVAAVAAVNAALDPYQRWRRRERTYYARPRYLNSGLIRTHEYDTLLLGNSTMENLRPGVVERELGGRCLKLPMPTLSARELAALLDAVFRAGKARRVLVGLDPYICRGDVDRLPYGRRAMPLHLYRNGILPALRYVLDLDTLLRSWRIRSGRLERKDGARFDADLYGYFAHEQTFSREAVCTRWRRGLPERIVDPDEHSYERLRLNFDTHIAPRIAAHPEIEFLLYHPPYSVVAWIDDARSGVLDGMLDFKDHVFETIGRLSHVRLFDFQAIEEISRDLAGYMDVVHPSPAVNERMVRMMAAGEARVTAEGRPETRRRIEEASRGPNPCDGCPDAPETLAFSRSGDGGRAASRPGRAR